MYQLREELAGYNRYLVKAPRPLTLRAGSPVVWSCFYSLGAAPVTLTVAMSNE